MYYGGDLDFVIFYVVISSKIHKNTVLDRPCTGTTLNSPTNNANLDISCSKTTSTPRAGGPAKPGHAASVVEGSNSIFLHKGVQVLKCKIQ